MNNQDSKPAEYEKPLLQEAIAETRQEYEEANNYVRARVHRTLTPREYVKSLRSRRESSLVR